MANERTFSIIKPDAVACYVIKEIYTRFEKAGLRYRCRQNGASCARQAEGFYAAHKGPVRNFSTHLLEK